LIDQFLKERTYLQNLSEPTLVWYRVAFKNYPALVPANAGLPTKAMLQQFVVALRERGIKPVTCNTYVGAMNAFCAWLHQEGHAPERVKLRSCGSSAGCSGCSMTRRCARSLAGNPRPSGGRACIWRHC